MNGLGVERPGDAFLLAVAGAVGGLLLSGSILGGDTSLLVSRDSTLGWDPLQGSSSVSSNLVLELRTNKHRLRNRILAA